MNSAVVANPTLDDLEPFPMRISVALPFLALVATAACSDDKPNATQLIAAPKASRLTLKTLSKDASSVCRANVAARDGLLAKGSSDADGQVSALDNVINDVCF
jgi:hypothetical protein